ncbi:MAG TPA: tRNA glutamyl-Q(34) synthetase GluQRS [Burkholderiales bacterium]|nr:tRNA glutamyl-Q(34) synthetase GluQRS [Burkholderiales bacterium]
MSAAAAAYRGRFAPTPSGPLHFGSLAAAVGSCLDARAHGGEWWLRIDDLDPPRNAPGAADAILRCLDAFGLHWDGAVVFQSTRTQAYAEALAGLRSRGLVYACACTRKEVGDVAVAGGDGPVYPGTCRAGLPPGRAARAWRVRTARAAIDFDDLLQGRVTQDVEREVGDFVLYRADHVHAYHLACVLDDDAQGVTHVVRGADLLASTPRQIYLQRVLGLPSPRYLHLPVALNARGEKLSKQTLARAVQPAQAPAALAAVLDFLGHAPPRDARGSLESLWAWARANWRRERLPRAAGIVVPGAWNASHPPPRKAGNSPA